MTGPSDPLLPSPPGVAPPPGACDSHTHVFDPALAPAVDAGQAAYPLPDTPLPVHRAFADRLGLSRGVIVQPAVYGANHRVLTAALRDAPDRLRGVALCDADVADDVLDDLHAAGVRAVRFVEMRVPGTDRRFPGSIPIDALGAMAPRLAARGWHAEIWADPATCAAVVRRHGGGPVALVFDHLAGTTTLERPDDDAFRTVRDAVAQGDAWVKLTLCRTAVRRADYSLARPFVEALIAAGPDNLVWGSDFPFLRKGEEAPDGGWLLDTLADWVGDARLLRRILCDNPANLYDFEGTADE